MQQKTLAILRALYLAASAVGFIVGCAHGDRNLRGKLWQGDAAHGEIYRAQDQKAISCSDPKFNQYSALLTTDLEAYGQACKSWR